MRGTKIIVSSPPRGRFDEGILGDTSSPGTMMQIKDAVSCDSTGVFTFVHYAPGADSDSRVTCILLEQLLLEGQPPAFPGSNPVAGVQGARCRVYYPLAGEEMNILVKGQAGTGSANAFTVGERLDRKSVV